MNNTNFAQAVDLLEADVGGETIALDAASGDTFLLSDVALFVWRNLEQPASFEQLHEQLLEHYEVEPEQCAGDLQELLSSLIKNGLVRTIDG